MSNTNNMFRSPSMLSILAIILITPALFFNTTMSMVQVWLVNETFTHGFLIFPISLWLIWQKHRTINQLQPEAEVKLVVVLIPILTLWAIANAVNIQVIQQLAMIALIPALVWLILGRAILLSVLFPLLFLFFAVPLGQELIPMMMDFTAQFTIGLIRLVDIPVYQDGLFFSLPSGNWSVVEECSGVRYLIASLSLGTIYAYISYTSLKKRSLFILFAILVPILANGLRAFGIVMIGHFSGMELAVGADHLLYGWVFFGIVIFIMFYVGSFWSDPMKAEAEPVLSPSAEKTKLGKTSIIIGGTAMLFIVATQLLTLGTSQAGKDNDDIIKLTLPESFQGWQKIENRSLAWQPQVKNPDAFVSQVYLFGDSLTQIDLAFYRSQHQGAEAVSSQNRLVAATGDDWKQVHVVDLKEGEHFVTESELRFGNQRLLVWHWYRIGSFVTPNQYIAKMFDAYNQLILGRNDATMITIATQHDSDRSISRGRLNNFYNDAFPQIYPMLEQLAK
jgi:exosortase A